MAPVAIIYLLNAARGPLADPRLRRALSLATDRDRLIAEVLDGELEKLLAGQGVDLVDVDCTESYVDPLRKFFLEREGRRKRRGSR